MQQSGNDEIKTMIFVLSLACAVIYAAVIFVALFVALIAGFLTLCLTILCLCAWEREITLFDHTLAPAEARAFIKRGLIGAGLSVAFLLFCGVALSFCMTDQAALYAALFGYVAGSLGVEFARAQGAQDAPSEPDILPPQIEQPPVSPARGLPAPDAKPFRFATWDDEEARR